MRCATTRPARVRSVCPRRSTPAGRLGGKESPDRRLASVFDQGSDSRIACTLARNSGTSSVAVTHRIGQDNPKHSRMTTLRVAERDDLGPRNVRVPIPHVGRDPGRRLANHGQFVENGGPCCSIGQQGFSIPPADVANNGVSGFDNVRQKQAIRPHRVFGTAPEHDLEGPALVRPSERGRPADQKVRLGRVNKLRLQCCAWCSYDRGV